MDKRASVRIPVRVRAQCRVDDTVIDGLVEDVSRSGLFLRAQQPLQLGDHAELDLDLPGDERIRVNAEIVRIENEPRAGMGLRFVGGGERTAKPLANFIMRQHATVRS